MWPEPPQCPRFKVLEMFPIARDSLKTGVSTFVLEKNDRSVKKRNRTFANADDLYFKLLVLVALNLAKIA